MYATYAETDMPPSVCEKGLLLHVHLYCELRTRRKNKASRFVFFCSNIRILRKVLFYGVMTSLRSPQWLSSLVLVLMCLSTICPLPSSTSAVANVTTAVDIYSFGMCALEVSNLFNVGFGSYQGIVLSAPVIQVFSSLCFLDGCAGDPE